MTTTTQAKFTVLDVYNRGYTVAAAARHLGCSTQHLRSVLKGARRSGRLMLAIAALPPRRLVLREPQKPVLP